MDADQEVGQQSIAEQNLPVYKIKGYEAGQLRVQKNVGYCSSELWGSM